MKTKGRIIKRKYQHIIACLSLTLLALAGANEVDTKTYLIGLGIALIIALINTFILYKFSDYFIQMKKDSE